MLLKANRLAQDRDFKKIFAKGKSFYSANLRVRLAVNKLPDTRFGIVVSTKVSKKATDRNRVKRIIRETIRELISEVKSGFDVVIVAKPSIINLKSSEVIEETKLLLKKSKLVV